MPCPRRAESGHSITPPDEDHWRVDHTCSYCGSLSPDEFMRALEAGARVDPTDKDYKAYIDIPNPQAGQQVMVSGHYGADAASEERYRADPSWRQIGPGRWERFGPAPECRNAKFYFQHLSREQRMRFVELLNAKRINIGRPGRFYVLPFFIHRG